jgi:phosphatidylinositol-3-phosphatase
VSSVWDYLPVRLGFPNSTSALALATALLFVAGCAQAHPADSPPIAFASRLPRSASSHVLVIMMENEESADVIGAPAAPYFNGLARRYGLATQSFAIAHPSLPNYLALTSGSTQGVTSDCTDCTAAAPNIVDQLEAAHISWKAYLESVPTPCFKGATAGEYAKKHNPFIYYDDVAGSPHRCNKLVGFGALATDLRHGGLPTYAWISPNLCNDGHDCGVAGGDRFLARTVPSLLAELGPHGLLVLTWDEGSSDAGCCGAAARGGHIATILAGPDVRRGSRDAQPVDHYGVLGTIEEALGLPPLAGAADPRSGRLSALFVRAPHIG